MNRIARGLPLLALAATLVSAGSVLAAPASYPTEALADYVLACMASNGDTPDAACGG